MVSTTFAVTMIPVPGAGIAPHPALRDLGNTLVPVGWAACAFVGVVLVALLVTIAVRSRPKAAARRTLGAGPIHAADRGAAEPTAPVTYGAAAAALVLGLLASSAGAATVDGRLARHLHVMGPTQHSEQASGRAPG